MEKLLLEISAKGEPVFTDEEGVRLDNQDALIDGFWTLKEEKAIESLLLQDESLKSDMIIMRNLDLIINNFFIEKELLVKDNYRTLLTLALARTKEELEGACKS